MIILNNEYFLIGIAAFVLILFIAGIISACDPDNKEKNLITQKRLKNEINFYKACKKEDITEDNSQTFNRIKKIASKFDITEDADIHEYFKNGRHQDYINKVTIIIVSVVSSIIYALFLFLF